MKEPALWCWAHVAIFDLVYSMCMMSYLPAALVQLQVLFFFFFAALAHWPFFPSSWSIVKHSRLNHSAVKLQNRWEKSETWFQNALCEIYLIMSVRTYVCVHPLPPCAWDSWRWRSEEHTWGLLLCLMHALKLVLQAGKIHSSFWRRYTRRCRCRWLPLSFNAAWVNRRRSHSFFFPVGGTSSVFFCLGRDRRPHASHRWEGLCVGDERWEHPRWDLHVRRARGLSHSSNRDGSPFAHGWR